MSNIKKLNGLMFEFRKFRFKVPLEFRDEYEKLCIKMQTRITKLSQNTGSKGEQENE